MCVGRRLRDQPRRALKPNLSVRSLHLWLDVITQIF